MKPIYLDFEDDITSVIHKINEATGSELSLVIPKRSTLLHSAVNMKLLLKSARDKGKSVSLVTQDAKVASIAAGQDVPVAGDTKSAAKVPETDKVQTEPPSDVIEGEEEAKQPEADEGKKAKPFARKPKKARAGGAKGDKKRVNIPDFDRFKKRLLLGGLAVLLLGLAWWFGARVLPSAAVVLRAQIRNTQADFEFTADTQAEEVDLEKSTLPAASHEVSKTLTEPFAATGKKDVGEKASGTMTIQNCEDTDPRSLPAGAEFTSGGKTFLSNAALTVPAGEFSGGGTSCDSDAVSVGVTAEKPGDTYNLAPASYTTPALSGNFVINGSQMSGGTSETVTVVSKSDVSKAKKVVIEREREDTKTELIAQFAEDEIALSESFTEKVTDTTSSPAVGEEASQAQLTVKVDYFMFGIKKDQVSQLIEHKLEEQSAEGEEDATAVLENEVEKALISLKDRPSTSKHVYRLQTQATLGPDIDLDQLRVDIADQGYSETLDQLKSLPNVSDADINLSPFWVFSMPKDPQKINITVELPEGVEQPTEE